MIYLDNAATTAPSEEAVAAMMPFVRDGFGNASSLHALGARSRGAINDARSIIADLVGCSPGELVFTSGGTEADALAVRGVADSTRMRHIVMSAIEHSAVLEHRESLERRGFTVDLVPCNADGLIDPTAVEAMVSDETALVAVMHANNEVGTIQPIGEIGARIKRKSPHTLFLVDAAQSFTKEALSPDRDRIDLLALSAHKIHGPKGAGALYVRKGTRITPLLPGGGQEGGLRSGTENVPAIVGFAAAAAAAARTARADVPRMRELRDRLIAGALEATVGAAVNGHRERRLCSNASLRFPGTRAEILLHLLESEGVYASSGSACHARLRRPSHVLVAMGLTMPQGTIRFTLSRDTTAEQIEQTLTVLREVVPRARKLGE